MRLPGPSLGVLLAFRVIIQGSYNTHFQPLYFCTYLYTCVPWTCFTYLVQTMIESFCFKVLGQSFTRQTITLTDNIVIPSWGVNWNMLTAGGSQGFQSFLISELFMSTWFMTQPQLNPITWFISAVPGICPINTNLLHFVSAEACKDGDGRPIKLGALLCHCNFGNFF